jgi:hypothetical protein
MATRVNRLMTGDGDTDGVAFVARETDGGIKIANDAETVIPSPPDGEARLYLSQNVYGAGSALDGNVSIKISMGAEPATCDWVVSSHANIDLLTAATGSVVFTALPASGETIRIISTDGTDVTYTSAMDATGEDTDFTGSGAGGESAVAANLLAAINHPTNHGNKITGVLDGAGRISLTQATGGTAGNTTITEGLANCTAVSFTGGLDAAYGEVLNSAGLRIRATASATTTSSTVTLTPTFKVETDAGVTAVNLRSCLDATGYFTTTMPAGDHVKIFQLLSGTDGNRTNSLSDSSPAGMSLGNMAGGVNTTTKTATIVDFSAI